ncbi:MAG: peptidoglycan DD-metalloendopeptidase family protein [Candidatus Rokubacteria bacterium]|nr:peptidoglycan DD-metalloendopeptidase family protein [Candidatus Rokubacteria bacterium]
MRRRVLLAAGIAVLVAAVAVFAGLRWWRSSGPTAIPAPAPAEPPAPRTVKRVVELRRGDNLVRALARQGIDHRLGNDIAAALKKSGADLKRLKLDDTLEITLTLEGEPVALTWEPSPWLGYAVVSAADGWTVERMETPPAVRVAAVKGIVERSLFQTVEDAGETAPLVLAFVGIFESDFDFTADTRRGDRFRVLVEKRYAGATFVDYGRILAAQYVADGKVLTGVGFEGKRGRLAYYDLAGQSLRKTFLKSPLEFSRITSGFTYARPHPILGGVRPHLAIDYAAPVGTPVRAVADATVLSAGSDGGNGLSVRLRHRRGYETMYNHLSKLGPGVRSGARIGQRQVIGYVGSTGLSTGPHLDYRVAKNGAFVNPLQEKFLPGEPIVATERANFLRHAKALLERLERDAPY